MNRDQLLAILWLRWRLTRNQFAKGSGLNAVISIILAVLLVGGGLVTGIGGFLVGLLALKSGGGWALIAAWDMVLFLFLLIWATGLVIEIQRSESIDLTRLLHLPVGLKQVFTLNYIASHASPSIILFVPLFVGLSAGLALSRHFWLLAILPVGLALIFALSAWTYCLRGWLAALMINKRRRRTIIVWITIVFVLVFQIPNILVNSDAFRKNLPNSKNMRGRNAALTQEKVLRAHLILPPGWVSYSAFELDKRNPLPALASVGGFLLLGLIGLQRAYRSTVRFYTGAGETRPVASPEKASSKRSRLFLVGRRLPFMNEDTAALTWATFQSMLRAPELKMAMIMPIVLIVLMFSAQILKGRSSPSEMLNSFAPVAVAIVASFSFANVMSNMFGLDRNGFRALVLLPTSRSRVLLAKNLAFFPFVFCTAALFLAAVTVWLRLGVLSWLAGMLQATTAFFLFSMGCNVLSILVPYRFAPGTLQAKKPKAAVFLGMLVTMLVLPVLMAPVFLPAAAEFASRRFGMMTWVPVNLLLTAIVLGVVLVLYRAVLPSQGRLLQKREQRILDEVTHETE